MIQSYYKEDNNRYVEVEKYGVIDLSKLPIILDKSKCHQIEWVLVGYGEHEGKRVLSESSGCSAFAHDGKRLSVIRVVGVDFSEE